MERKDCASMFQVVDTMEYIKKERERLMKIVSSPQYKDKPQWGWMAGWLRKTDEEHYAENVSITNWELEDSGEYDSGKDYIDNKYCCSICFKVARKLLNTSFSFCLEYGCGMNLCKECAEKVGELAKLM